MHFFIVFGKMSLALAWVGGIVACGLVGGENVLNGLRVLRGWALLVSAFVLMALAGTIILATDFFG